MRELKLICIVRVQYQYADDVTVFGLFYRTLPRPFFLPITYWSLESLALVVHHGQQTGLFMFIRSGRRSTCEYNGECIRSCNHCTMMFHYQETVV